MTDTSSGSSTIPPGPPLGEPGRSSRRPGIHWLDASFQWMTRISAIVILAMLAALLVVLVNSALPTIHRYGARFLASSDWRPNELEVPKRDARGKLVIEDGEVVQEKVPPSFGSLPVIYGTGVSSALALLFAVPLSIGAALFLIRLAPARMRGIVSFLIEFLATIPSIAYGIWGLFVLAPLLQSHVEPGLQSLLQHVPGFHWLFVDTRGRPLPLTGRDMFCGGLILAIMILPIITAISRDVLQAVPRAQIEGALALGATWWESVKVMLQYSKSGLFGAVMLGLARAAGETMAVTMVIGNNSQIQPSVFAPAQTMSSLLANEFSEAETMAHRSALVEVALILLVLSLAFNIVARLLFVGSSVQPSRAA
jgi:phosphate transport system permease protein